MHITGKLKDDIISGQTVLFLGAGVGQAAGLFGGVQLASYLFNAAGKPIDYGNHKQDLARLVAKLDKDHSYTRQWVNTRLKDYFLDRKNYKNLDYHKKLLSLHWKAIFTTNYDSTLEFAEQHVENAGYRLLPIVSSRDNELFLATDLGKLKYYKIHGCCKELELHPKDAPALVITQRDFQNSLRTNSDFMQELKRYAYTGSIVFIGFQAHRSENNVILATVQDAVQAIATSFHEPFRPFVVLKNIDDETRSDLNELDLNILDGSFEEFVEAALALQNDQTKRFGTGGIEDKVYIKAAGKEIEVTKAEHQQYGSQFVCYHESYLEEKLKKINGMSAAKLVDLWKGHPSDIFLAGNRYIKRTSFSEIVSKFQQSIKNVIKKQSPQVFFIEGDRASGKSVIAKQLANVAYLELNQPVLFLTPQASYFDKNLSSHKEISVSGWDGRLIDKFISLFYDDDERDVVPILVADHLAYRHFALDHLLKYLENHGKPCLLILTLNSEQWTDESHDRILQAYKYATVHVNHKLDDNEILELFETISRDEPHIRDRRNDLISRAKDTSECDRDILFILYAWFDKHFRRLDEIIAEETDKISSDDSFRNLYLGIAVFHQYNFSPRFSLLAEALGISIDSFSQLLVTPAFKVFVNLTSDIDEGGNEFASTRHSEFSRKIISTILQQPEDQVALMCRILKCTGQSDLQFTRDFLNYIYRYGISFSADQITRLKEATEVKLGNDYVLNHQFGAYLVREKGRLGQARYYLDLALQEDPDNSAIIHSIGNLCYTLYKDELENNAIAKADEYFHYAKDYFSKSRSLTSIKDEHAYYTDIDMTRYRIVHGNDSDKARANLNADSHALTLEALRVVPFERQVLLRRLIGSGTPFNGLPVKEQKSLFEDIMSGTVSPLLLEYYAVSLLCNPGKENWDKLKLIATIYGKRTTEVSIATVIGLITKKAFLKNAETRFEYLRSFYDRTVRYREVKISFALLAEYVRLLSIDAFVLEKYDFLRAITGDLIDLFREARPRFLKDEYILNKSFYMFDERDSVTLLKYFISHASDFSLQEKARRFSKLAHIIDSERERYFPIEIDPVTRFFVRGFRKEVGTNRGKISMNFCVKYTYDGFHATDFRV